MNSLSAGRAVEVAELFPFAIDLWRVQNIYWSILHEWYPRVRAERTATDTEEPEWEHLFAELGARLGVRISE